MKIGPLFKWFGSKWQSAKRYPKPKFDTIFEPFAGGAGYSLNHCEKKIFIYDTDPNLKTLWKWLIKEATEKDVLSIPINLPVGTNIQTIGLSEGQQQLLKHWQRTNNVGDCWTVSPWGNKPGQWTANTRSRVAEEIHAIKHWNFGKFNYTGSTATFFVDPPYQFNYRYRTGKRFDFIKLAQEISILANNGNQIIVCEAIGKNGVPDWLPFVENHQSVTSRRKANQSHHSKELIWTSG